jgi:hypothetical protein
MSDTPKTDAKSFIALDKEGRKLVVVLASTSKSFERERNLELERSNHYRDQWQTVIRERDKARAQNAKLREIAEAAIMCASLWAGSRSSTPRNLRAELDQLKEVRP